LQLIYLQTNTTNFIFGEKSLTKIGMYAVEDIMDKKITVTFIESGNETERKQKIIEILAGGFYHYLKANGYLKKNPEREKQVEQVLEETQRICHGELDKDLSL
jgi:ribonuclease BN (tRNA processing enzyme)